MNSRYFLRLGLLVLAGLAQANAAEIELSKSTMAKLRALPAGEQISLDGFPVGPAVNRAVRFHRVEVYAPNAHVYLVTEEGQKELPHSTRTYLRGYAQDGSARVAMSLNADGSFAEGNGSGPDGAFVLRGKSDASGAHHIAAQTLESTIPAGYHYSYKCGNEGELMDLRAPNEAASSALSANSMNAVASAPSAFRFATVAVDTDSLFMSQLFSNNLTSATNWIAQMFNTMNTMYENDLNVQLVQGTTFLRVSTDPYGNISNVPADRIDLDRFGTYWQAHYGTEKRSFATLLSGRGPCSSCGAGCVNCSASGIAWINQFCQAGFVGDGGGGPNADFIGSYSVVQVFASQTIDPNAAIAARLTGHELGHNFGAAHTHCTDKNTGHFFTATNTIDQCYNGEGATHSLGSGQCYDGNTLSCPAGGAGSIMSYCNISGCGQDNLLQFNGTQISATLAPNVTAHTPSCLYLDGIFLNGFN